MASRPSVPEKHNCIIYHLLLPLIALPAEQFSLAAAAAAAFVLSAADDDDDKVALTN